METTMWHAAEFTSRRTLGHCYMHINCDIRSLLFLLTDSHITCSFDRYLISASCLDAFPYSHTAYFSVYQELFPLNSLRLWRRYQNEKKSFSFFFILVWISLSIFLLYLPPSSPLFQLEFSFLFNHQDRKYMQMKFEYERQKTSRHPVTMSIFFQGDILRVLVHGTLKPIFRYHKIWSAYKFVIQHYISQSF